MVDDFDWEAMCNSEVFRNYVNNEMRREANEIATKKANFGAELEAKLDEELKVYADIENFQKRVDADPKLREQLLKCKKALIKNPELIKNVDKSFIAGIELLDLSGE